MIWKAFTLLDTKTGHFKPPFFVAHMGEAMRMLQDTAQDPNTVIGRHPEDFMLCDIGTYDDATGQMAPTLPNALCSAASLLPQQAPLAFEQAIRTVDESHVGPNGRS